MKKGPDSQSKCAAASPVQMPLLRIAVFLLTLAFLLPAASAFAAERSSVLRVGIFPFEGFYEVNSVGDREGYGYELLQMMGQHANVTYEYIDKVPKWSDLEQMLLDGKLDLLTCVQKTPENEARFAFSEEPIGTSYTMMSVKSGNDAITAGDYRSYDGLRVGVLRGNAHAQKFSDFAQANDFSYIPVEYDNLDTLEAALQSGAVDAIATSSLRPLHNEWIVEQFMPSPYYLMMRKDDVHLQQTFNQAIQQLDVTLPNWRSELFNRYYTPDSGESLQLTADERKYLSDHAQTVFRVAVCPDNAPYSYVENGEAKGIIPEIFAEIAERAGIQYQVVASDSHEEYKNLMSSGTVDLIMDSGWDYSAAEKAGYKLTSSYISLSLAQVSKIGNGSEIRKVAVPDGSVWEALSKLELPRQYSLQKCTSVADTVNAVLSGDCDAAFLFEADAQNYLANDVRSRLRISLLPTTEVDISVASAFSNDYLLLSILSKSAESVKGSFVQDTVLKYTANAVEHIDILDYLYLNPTLGIFAIAVLALFLFAIAIIAYQRIWNERQKHLTSQMQAAKQEADTANAAKSSFLSSMSHDLRTPLNGILGFTGLAIRAPQIEEKQQYLQKIQSSGELLLDLVNDALDLSRIESGKQTFEPERVNCHELMGAVITAVRPTAEQNGVRLLADVDDFPDETVSTDRMKVQKILLNLLSNAVKYTPRGGTVSMSVCALNPPEHGCTRRIVIQDTGIGMGEDFLEKLYEPFAQERRPEFGTPGGTGLGLSIVKKTVDFLGGSISVRSKRNVGTCFTVDLPILPAEEASSDHDAQTGHAVSLSGKHILLCEDNSVNMEIAVLLLKEFGMSADCAKDGREGVQRFESSPPGAYDAILMDIRMPGMNGYEAAAAIRRLPRADAPNVPILAMTADAFEDDIRKCMDAGMNGHISKPIDPSFLFSALRKAMS